MLPQKEHEPKKKCVPFSARCFSLKKKKNVLPSRFRDGPSLTKKTHDEIMGVKNFHEDHFLRSEPNKICRISEHPGRFKARNKTKGVW